jgi:hypothetical protein
MKTRTAGAAAALAAGALLLTTGSASAAADLHVALTNTGHGVGVYWDPNSGDGKASGDLWYRNGDSVYIDCWVVGESIGGQGDVWYATSQVVYGAANTTTGFTPDVWTFAPYVDGAAAFHAGLPRC